MEVLSDFVILNGFDRSGSSAISKTLSNHPKTELIMHPFNSGFIRRKMYKVFGEEVSKEVNQALLFFKDLNNKKINDDLINSHWHYEHSTTLVFVPKKLHIIKTTINHLAQKWMRDNFPELDVWGIWREPKEIVSSIIRNDFYGKWYEDAIVALKETVESVDFLRINYLHFIGSLDTDIKRTSFILAVRTHFFLCYLDPDKLIDYNIFNEDANAGLDNFCNYYNLRNFNFNEFSKKDLNITGKPFYNRIEFSFSKDDNQFMDEIFTSINKLKQEKFRL